jgi:hypothetical protein
MTPSGRSVSRRRPWRLEAEHVRSGNWIAFGIYGSNKKALEMMVDYVRDGYLRDGYLTKRVWSAFRVINVDDGRVTGEAR